jgi:uncharacterized ion transporter superfamily protein YfcC
MDKVDALFEKYFKSPFKMIFCGGVILIVLSWIFPSGNYNGSGMHVIFAALEGEAVVEGKHLAGNQYWR